MAPLRLATPACLAAAIALVGCNFGTDDPVETVQEFYDAVASGDVPAACEEIVPDAQELFYPEPVVEAGVVVGYAGGCADPKQVELDAEARQAAENAKVASGKVDGDTATVKVETVDGDTLVFDLVRIDERWRLKAPAELLTGLDSDAKSAARMAQTAIETYASDNQRSYVAADAAALREIQPALDRAYLSTVTGDLDTYEIGVTSASGTEFTIERTEDGEILSKCDDAGLGGCAAGGVWTEFAE